ncbi:MAG: AarF/UbiB family protein [Burkholderiaceae bacterium]
MLREAFGAIRDLGRVNQIAAVLIRYGFGDLVHRIGLAGALERAGRILHWQTVEGIAQMTLPMRLRRSMEDLGPTFVKLGQVLATRVDLFPPDWIAEFGRLQNGVPAVPWSRVLPQLREDLGDEPHHVFPVIDETPLAAASLAQAHRAQLPDGTEVVLKIRRPGIRQIIEADLRLMLLLAEVIEAKMPDLRRYRPKQVVQQFMISLRRELDFGAECRNAERVAHNFAEHPEIVVPRVYWEWTGERLNVQERVTGIEGSRLDAIEPAGLDRRELARRGAQAVLKMILEDGLFHADPHPGNVFYLPDNRIAFIDFGMVGWLSRERRYQLAQLLHGLAIHDSESAVHVLIDWAEADGDAVVDETRLLADIDAFVDQYRGVPLRQYRLSNMLSEAAAILREHGLVLPPDLVLMVKAFISLEGLGRQLDPDFDMATQMTPYLEQVLMQRHRPAALARHGWRALGDAVTLLSRAPRDLRQLLRSARSGRLHMQIEITSLKAFGEQIDRASNRLTLGVVTAALIVGSSIVMHAGGEAGSKVQWLGILGFVAAAFGGFWILVSILRSRRK